MLYEEIQAMFQVVSEGHGALDQKLESLLGEVRRMRKELESVEEAVIESRKCLDTLMNRFETHEHARAN